MTNPAPRENNLGVQDLPLGVQDLPLGVQEMTLGGAESAPKPSVTVKEPSKNRQTLAPSRGPYTDEFETFWKPYPPTNGSKADAFKAWKQLKPEQRVAAMDALPAWLACDQWQNGYIKHAGSWLRGKLWEVPPTSRRAPPRGGYTKPEDRRPAVPKFTDIADRYR
ncbi:MAG: hypothetical protein H0U59_10655 [Gemmatimonadaceae bacterium]|nr:hypothetical protein [Gemmatimonadaceae bacterium]